MNKQKYNIKFIKCNLSFQNIITNKSNVLDFEKYIQEKKTLLLNDPLRDILLYPSDDVSVSIV